MSTINKQLSAVFKEAEQQGSSLESGIRNLLDAQKSLLKEISQSTGQFREQVKAIGQENKQFAEYARSNIAGLGSFDPAKNREVAAEQKRSYESYGTSARDLIDQQEAERKAEQQPKSAADDLNKIASSRQTP